MTDTAPAAGPASRNDESLFPRGAGERLRAAREAQGLSLADIAARTRVPIRHLEAIESGDYSEMPTPTYAIGFAKAYARAVGEDEVTIAREVRGKTAAISAERQNYQPYELDDPKRVPPRGLAVAAAVIAVVVLIGALVWLGSDWFSGAGELPTTVEQAVPAAQPVAHAPVPAINPAGGQVALTALDRVWVRVHDGSGKTLYEATMNAGDTYAVPVDANHPMLTVGRPDKLKLTVDGKDMPPLGSGAKPMKDVPIDAAALAARETMAPPAAPEAVTAPSATPTSTAPTTSSTPEAAPVPAASPAKPKPAEKAPARPKKTPAAKPSKKPLNLDLTPAPAPLPTTNGIY